MLLDAMILLCLAAFGYYSIGKGLTKTSITLLSIVAGIIFTTIFYPLIALVFLLVPMLAAFLGHLFSSIGADVAYVGQFIVAFNQASPTLARIYLLVVIAFFIIKVSPNFLRKYLDPYLYRHSAQIKATLNNEVQIRRVSIFGSLALGIMSGLLVVTTVLIILVTSPFEAALNSAFNKSILSSSILKLSLPIQSNVEFILSAGKNRIPTTLTTDASEKDIKYLGFKVAGTEELPAESARLMELLNSERTRMNIPPLEHDPNLHNLAVGRGKDMFARGYFSHFTPEGNSPFLLNDSLPSRGENIAFTQQTDTAHDLLMQSPGHKENIMDPVFTKVGVAVVDGGSFGKMFVQEFSQ